MTLIIMTFSKNSVQQNNSQHYDIQQNAMQPSGIEQNKSQHYDTQLNATQLNHTQVKNTKH